MKDNDVDFTVKIAPNTTKKSDAIKFDVKEEDLAKIFKGLKVKFKNEAKKSHTLYFESTDKSARLMISNPDKTVDVYLGALDKEKEKRVNNAFDLVKGIDDLATEFFKASSDKRDPVKFKYEMDNKLKLLAKYLKVLDERKDGNGVLNLQPFIVLFPKLSQKVLDNFPADFHSYLKGDYVDQLAAQEAAINSMTILVWRQRRSEFVTRREAQIQQGKSRSRATGRHPEGGAEQRQFTIDETNKLVKEYSKEFRKILKREKAEQYTEELRKPGVSEEELKMEVNSKIEEEAMEMAEEKANDYIKGKEGESTLKAALHEADQVGGGHYKEDLTRMGDSAVNSFLGGRWPPLIRTLDKELDSEIKEQTKVNQWRKEDVGSILEKTKMNVQIKQK